MKKLGTLMAAMVMGGVVHATIVELDPTAPIIVDAPPPTDPTAVGEVTYSPFPADRLWHSDDATTDFNPQDFAHIQSVIEGLSGDTLTFVYEYEENGGPDWSYSGDAFNYMAVHYDNQELVFYYETAITDFSVFGLTYGFSNARAYTGLGDPGCEPNCNPTDVDSPASFGLLALGLCGLFAARMRK